MMRVKDVPHLSVHPKNKNKRKFFKKITILQAVLESYIVESTWRQGKQCWKQYFMKLTCRKYCSERKIIEVVLCIINGEAITIQLSRSDPTFEKKNKVKVFCHP
jgi:hypothetical protein